MLADRVVVVFRVALEADEVGDVVLPHVGIFPICLGEPPRVVNMPDAGVVGGEGEFDNLLGIGYRGKRRRQSTPVRIPMSGSFSSWGMTPSALAVLGIIPINPSAPAQETTVGSNFDS